ncbi:MAG TPA: chitinase [Firmicutes bacterium]|nr:chitinase [Bacillota bacterium]
MKKPLLAAYCTNRGIPQLTEEDIRRLDVLYIAFGRVDGTSVSLQELTELGRMEEIRRLHPEIRLVLTTASGAEGGFPAGTKTEADARKLAACLAQTVRDYGFDGLDVDWEYPTTDGDPSERHAHTVLLKALREELDKLEGRHTLSIAAGCKTWYFEITELAQSVQYLDYVNLMTYDINANCPYTMHHACPYPMATDKTAEGSAAENIEVFHRNGVPLEKILIGAAWYSRQWKGVPDENHGLHAYAGEGSDYGPGYTPLMRDYVGKNGYVRYWDDAAKAPYLFNGENFITYDDEESLRWKCRLVRESGIAGIMVWEYTYDEEHTLLRVMDEALRSPLPGQ